MIKKLKWQLKNWLKKSQILSNCLHKLLFLYLQIVYKTSRWQISYQDQKNYSSDKSNIYALWHNQLACAAGIFENYKSSFNSFKNTYVLISPHNDGKVISKIIRNLGIGVLEGSSNKNSVGVLKQIILKLSEGAHIAITPDGPRGPVYQMNSSITEIAKRYKVNLIPFSCISSNFFLLRSWDKLIMPLPFGVIHVLIGAPVKLTETKQTNDANLTNQLNILSEIVRDKIKNK